jgi:glutamine amidotransferase
MISVLDYGIGNAKSVIRMIEKVGGTAKAISSPEEVLAAKKLILPGVGAFDHGIKQLQVQNLNESLNYIAKESKTPILGICLGMQIMCKHSEEGKLDGFGWIDAVVTHFGTERGKALPVPHMGWNNIHIKQQSALFTNNEQRFYFAHSYWVKCNNTSDVIATADYGGEFVAAFNRDNLYGVQFHPEKSHRFGMSLIKKFVELTNVKK